MFKKIISGILAVIILVSTSQAAFASTYGDDNSPCSIDDGDCQLESTNDFAEIVSDAMQPHSEQKNCGLDYSIVDISMHKNIASVEINNADACNVAVSVYDESTNELIGFGIERVGANAQTANVKIETDNEMPEYYVVKATAIDENYVALCETLTSEDNTEWYSDFKESKTTDFDDEYVLNLDDSVTDNFAVLDEDVIIIDDDVPLKLVSVKNEDTTIYKIDENIENVFLKDGDVFCYNKNDVDNMVLGKVMETTIRNNSVIITANKPDLEDTFSIIKVHYDEEECKFSAVTGGMLIEPEETKSTKTRKAQVDATLESPTVKFPLGTAGPLKGNVLLSSSLNIKIEWSLRNRYFSTELRVTPKASVSFSVTAKYEGEKRLGEVNIPTGVIGLYVKIEFYLVFEASCKMSLSFSVSQTKGFGWDTESGTRDLSKRPVVEAEVKVEGSLMVGFRIDPLISLVGVVKLGFKGLLGIEVSASSSWSISNSGERHDCIACISGELNFVVSLSFTIKLNLVVWKKDIDFTITGKISLKISDFYWSITHGNFDWGACPYRSYKISFIVTDMSGKPISGAVVDNKRAGSNGTVSEYYPDGIHRVKIGAKGYKSKTIAMGFSAPRTYNVRLNQGSSDIIESEEDSSVSSYNIQKASRGRRTYVAPLTYTEPREGVVLSTALCRQRRSDVAWVQRELKNLGYNITVDGYYGNSTESVVRQFQSDYGLPVDGKVGANTLSMIKKPVKRVASPTLTLTTASDIPSGGIASIAWNAVEHADNYNVYLYNSSGDLVNSVINTKATAASFVVYEAGQYIVKAVANNSRYTSETASMSTVITAHAPAQVTFYDWDGRILSKQFVEYGKNAVTPAAPERDGHTFSKWDKDYSNLTIGELSVNAVYTRNVYTVTFLNSDGKTLVTEKVNFSENATAPDTALLTIPNGYSFTGWNKSFDNIIEDTTVKPVLHWENEDLPIILEECTVTEDEGYGYHVSVTARNYDLKRTSGRVVVALKTSSGKLLAMTESSAFTLARSNSSTNTYSKEALEIFVKYSGNESAYIDIYTVGTYSTLIPISAAMRYSITSETIQSDNQKTIFGQLDASLAGKQLMLVVYKIGDASDYTNEYIGQTVVGDDGSYSFELELREEPSRYTGDFTVVLGLEGTDTLIYLDSLKVDPVPEYTVTIVDYDDSIISEQRVKEGESAVLPESNPEREGYTFAGWDYSNTSIHEDLRIRAIYVAKKYTVVFIDWTNKRFDAQTYVYGQLLETPDLTSPVEYDAIGWDGVVDGMTVTENMVITAKYEKKTSTVRFFDYEGNLIDTQVVEYGEAADVSSLESSGEFLFIDWDQQGLDCVTRSMDVRPEYYYSSTTLTPYADIPTGEYNNDITVSLACATDGATIYYSINDGERIRYTGPFTLSETAQLLCYAKSDEKNESDYAYYYYAINKKNTADNKHIVQMFEDDSMLKVCFVAHNQKIPNSIIEERTGYNLDGLYTDKDCTAMWNMEEDVVVESTVLYAKWEPKVFTVMFKNTDGSVIDTQRVQYFEAAQAPTDVEAQIGYAFMGWDTDDYLCVMEDVTTTAVFVGENEMPSISINKSSYTIMEGCSYQLLSTAKNSTGDIIWSSDDEAIAEVSKDGCVTALSEGLAIITAFLVGENLQDMCFITVVSNPTMSLTLKDNSKQSLSNGYLFGISPSENTVSSVRAQINAENVTFKNVNNILSDNDRVKTGTMVEMLDKAGNVIDTAILVVVGDVDKDGNTANRDAAHIMNYLVGKEEFDEAALLAADVNGDGDVNNRDVSMLTRFMVGKETL